MDCRNRLILTLQYGFDMGMKEYEQARYDATVSKINTNLTFWRGAVISLSNKQTNKQESTSSTVVATIGVDDAMNFVM